MRNGVTIHGEVWDNSYIDMMIAELSNLVFTKVRWQPRDALVSIDGSRATLYAGEEYDPGEYMVLKKYWDHDHCEICNWLITNKHGEEHAVGYYNGREWLCEECYNMLVDRGVVKR